VLRVARWKYRTQKSRQKSPSRHHRTTLSDHIFATKTCIDNWKKNLFSSYTSSACPDNMVNFDPLTAEIGSGVWGGGAENAGVENAGVEKAGVDGTGGKCRSGKTRSRCHGWKMQEWKKQE